MRVNVIGGEMVADDTAARVRYATVAGGPLPEIVQTGLLIWEWIGAVLTRARKVAGEPGDGLTRGLATGAPSTLAVTAANRYLSDQKRAHTGRATFARAAVVFGPGLALCKDIAPASVQTGTAP